MRKYATATIGLLFILLYCSSCSSNWHLKRSKYHERMAVAKGAISSPDTIFILRKVYIPSVKVDSIFVSPESDTVFISKERLKIKYVNLPGDSVFIEGECTADTVKITVPVTITKEITAPKGFWYYFPWILVLLGAFLLLYFFIRKRS
jgi:hypothetical protein